MGQGRRKENNYCWIPDNVGRSRAFPILMGCELLCGVEPDIWNEDIIGGREYIERAKNLQANFL